ncbi:enoyl-CoA hydratase-related protein [Pseudoroseomonas cervicalis]|uniref:enoyl-CoA hydratase-related protein n=1 Tax=Teichococcus cervicalis TaxID=204525 RepID=UPI002788EF28|nr:enoyl-CoA hydratase-related protein [Pseudoroseomonas cervicalis]MDQ1079845.1 methylglutaconyl-CoA hydratase [Pseudoroseomonas cervicalis]
MTALVERREPHGVHRLTLNRPERHNAFDDALIAELEAAFHRIGRDPEVRLVVLDGNGASFSAGADLDWMRRAATQSEAENAADATAMARMLYALDRLPRPTVALVQGAAYGGGVGLAACCDIAIGAENARFCLSEVKLGLTPSTISPFVIAAIGARQARRYFLTAEVFGATRAQEIGLLHQVVPEAELQAAGAEMVATLLRNAPGAQADAKALVFLAEARAVDDAYTEETGRRIASRRASAEGREGIAAFLSRRKPAWVPEHGP